VHEHLPVGQGELDFKTIFENYLKDFDGKIIFEVVSDNDEDIINSKTLIQKILNDHNKTKGSIEFMPNKIYPRRYKIS